MFRTAILSVGATLALASNAATVHSNTNASIDDLHVAITKTAFVSLPESEQSHIAKIWDVTRHEYGQYLSDMHNTPDGKWYKTLDPAEVLLINAKDEDARMHYAKIVARMAHDRGSREMAAQVAYNKAFKLLYPGEPRIRIPHDSAFMTPELGAGDVIVYFTDLSSPIGKSTLQTLMSIVRSQKGVHLKIYLEGNPSSADVQSWASAQKIPHDLYKQGVITMQIDSDGYFKTLTHGKSALPFVALDAHGKLKPVGINNLWIWQE